MYGEGISRIGEIVDLGVKLEIIDKGGAWFTVEGNRIQGRDGVKQYLLDNPDVCERLEARIREEAWRLSPNAKQCGKSVSEAVVSSSAVNVSADDFAEG